MKSVLSVGLVLSLTITLMSCAQPPQQELDAAQASLNEAKNAEADIYASDTYQSARTALDEANAQVGEKDYETAKASAIRAKDLADQARAEGEANKQRTRDEAQAIVNRTSTGLTDARTGINGAPRGKGADDDIDQLRSDLGQVETGLSDARGNLNSGRFKDAVDQARNAESRLGQVQGAMQTAMQKIETWKEKNRPWYEL